jgi:hypothetical protein
MSRYSREGSCESCDQKFRYFLVDSSQNDSTYAYCETCGTTALVTGANPTDLEACSCGGRFRSDAFPRCPSCRAELSAESARSWIEANSRRTRSGWTWQGSWQGPYCIVIENRVTTVGS